MKDNPPQKQSIQTRCIHGGEEQDLNYNAVTAPIYATSTFAFDAPMEHKGFDYSRTGNPTRQALEKALANLEGGARASATTTGMAAVTTALHTLPKGAHIITGHDIYGGTYRLFAEVLPDRGFSFSFVDMRDPANVTAAIREETAALWIETPSNPLLNLVDIKELAAVARDHGLKTMVDNTFMTPVFQQPFELGADLIVHSTTKYLNGHSDVVGGAVISLTEDDGERVEWMINNLGTCCAPFDAWLVLRGLRTLPIRMKAHEENARALATLLADHPAVEKVYFPGLKDHPQYALAQKQMSGLGGMLSFDIRGGAESAFKCCKALNLFAFAESLGGVNSLIEHPESMSHASMTPEARKTAGILPGNLRVSTGIESAADLVADMRQALEAV